MTLPRLRVGNKIARYSIIQGGMSIRISLHRLAAKVAEAGGIGTIGAMGIPPQELRREVRLARLLSAGVLGVNLMYAGSLFDRLLDVCIEEKVDYVAIGAGFARGPFKRLSEAGIPGFCIISSEKAARIAANTQGVTDIVVESGEAGGHLGPKDTSISTWKLFPSVLKVLHECGFAGAVIAAGGILNRCDVERALTMGADGVQLGTRFAATEESSASEAMKTAWRTASGSQAVDWSPAGMPGRVIVPHTKDHLPCLGEPGVSCIDCLKHCRHRDGGGAHCIWNALNNAQIGNLARGLVFCGSRVGEIRDIISVSEVFKRLLPPITPLTTAAVSV